ncbi:MAG: methyltransferase [Pseudomonadota bacterium]
MSIRLSLAIDAGAVDPTVPTVAFGAAGNTDLSPFPDLTVIQTFRPDYDVWASRGVTVATEPTDGALALVFLPRSKAAARARVADAVRATNGLVVIDGQKTDGIESLLKDLKSRAEVPHVLSKAHGKLAVIGPGADVADWADPGPTRTDRFWTQPGVFSADGPDPGSRLLAEHLPPKLGPVVADLGAGWGYLAQAILSRETATALHLVEAEKRALDCARLNVRDARAEFHWADARKWGKTGGIDTVLMNPPFHEGRKGDPGLGVAFIQRAAELLQPKGQLFLVANRHLPYEPHLESSFRDLTGLGGDRSYKVFRASRPRQPKV